MLRTNADATGKKRPRSERFEARVSREQKDLFLRAAELQGRSLTDFVIASAQQAAVDIVRTYDTLRLGEKDRQAFVSALISPPVPSKKLKGAAGRYRERMER